MNLLYAVKSRLGCFFVIVLIHSGANYRKTEKNCRIPDLSYCQQNKAGSIINIASLAALRASGPIVYTAAKGAIKSMSKNLGQRFGAIGVRVNTIYPGFIVTEMTEKVYEHPEEEERLKADSSLGKLGEVDDIAYCALYLASDAAKFVTGQDFVVDGGATCW